MTFRYKQEICSSHDCDKEAHLQCSICGKKSCEQHCKLYDRYDTGLYYCHLSLKVCVHCEKTLSQLDPGDLLAKIEIDHIRYA